MATDDGIRALSFFMFSASTFWCSVERQIFALPLRYGGLGIVNPADYGYKSSLHSITFLQSSSCFFDVVWNPHTVH